MSWVANDIDTTIGLSLGGDVEVTFRVGEPNSDDITLVIGDSVVQISFDSATVEALRDKADAAVREFRERTAQPSLGAAL